MLKNKTFWIGVAAGVVILAVVKRLPDSIPMAGKIKGIVEKVVP
jgi:hypothetical protein